jgi:YVTN family beta-propeller protein
LDETTALNRSRLSRRALIPALVTSLILTVSAPAQTPAAVELLRLDSKIPLGPVRGRIDHMAIDVAHQRLFIAELGNDSLGVVDLATRKTIRTIGGLAEPQGVGYAPSVDTIYVANARDGSIRLFHGADYTDAGRIELGSDADNVRVDADVDRVLVGYGAGAIAAIDATQHRDNRIR